jgi:hypothetical protein
MKKTFSFVAIIALSLSSSGLSAQSITKKVMYGAQSPAPTPKVTEGKQSASPNPNNGVGKQSGAENSAAELKINPANANHNAGSNVTYGHFDADFSNKAKGGSAIEEHINVNYAYSQSPDNKSLDVMLNTAEPTLFTVQVVDANGKVKANWAANVRNHIHQPKIDISNLSAGNYNLNIFWDKSTTAIKSIPFKRVINTEVSAGNVATQGNKK